MKHLGVNIDHVATLREARKTNEPSPMEAAFLVVRAGASNITVHLREDKRHIQDHDVIDLRSHVRTPLNLEMALDKKLIAFAKKIKPDSVCLVPEKRQEITTEGGFSAQKKQAVLRNAIQDLRRSIPEVSVFIDPVIDEIRACHKAGATSVELHTGTYARYNLASPRHRTQLKILQKAAAFATSLNLAVHAGHGLTYLNITPLTTIEEIHTFNIGHSIISRAVFVGIEQAVKDMLALLKTPSQTSS